jgi:hypothetical protein
MKRFYFIFLLITQIFGQNLQREPVATPAPFQLRQNLYVSAIHQPLSKQAVVGDTTFYIRKNINDSEVNLESVEFYKLFENDTLTIYTEVAEYDNGHVTDETIQKVLENLLYRTPEKSVNPQQGILTNELALFGDIPDVDKNGKLFVLLIDVRDDYDSGSSNTYVAGYFDPLDQMKSKGNYSDIIYIDTYPANTTDDYTLGVVAHELQHLIHYHYDSNESVWANEGFSELAPLLLGYTSRSFSGFLTQTNRKLETFDGSLLDYSKVGLWTFYIYKRFGIELLQQVLRNSSNGLLAFTESLTDGGYNLTGSQLMNDWFLANLLNDETYEDGRYSYFSEDIPALQSEFFHANFTEGQIISGSVNPQAAQYIQFNGGRNINFSLDVERHSAASLAIIKHTEPVSVTFPDISSGKLNLEDLAFGKQYQNLTFVLSWTAALNNNASLDFSYSAAGAGGFEELELTNDKDTINYYIALGLENIAAEKFVNKKESEITALKFNGGNTAPANLYIYRSLTNNPVKAFANIPSNYQEWTIFHLPEPLSMTENSEFFVAIEAAGNEPISMGYAETGNNDDNSFLRNGGVFYDLDNFSVDDGDSKLDGNWCLRAVVRSEIFKEAELVVNPDTVIFSETGIKKEIYVENMGTEVLNWEIGSTPSYIKVNQNAGVLSGSRTYLELESDLRNFQPGVYSENLVFNSNFNQDSLNIIAIKPNETTPQAGYILEGDIFSENLLKMKVFNIGTGNSEFSIENFPDFLAVSPAFGTLASGDTQRVNLRIDTTMIDQRYFSFVFDNGVYQTVKNLKYPRTLTNHTTDGLKLFQNAPNPFVVTQQGYTDLLVRLPDNKKAKLKIYDVQGKIVKNFPFHDFSPGLHLFRWDGRSDSGKFASSGVYFVYLEQSEHRKINKLLLIK